MAAATLAQDDAIVKAAMNSAPALSPDQKTLYVALNSGTGSKGYLVALDAATLQLKAKRLLADPQTGEPARVTDDSTASPTIGPDGDVFFGVLETRQSQHNSRGWLLHFDATLAQARTPGSFGWDDTASIVPAAMVPGYTGSSKYLLTTKYNNYGRAGSGDSKNKVAVLDPNASQPDLVAPGVAVMKEVLVVMGVTPDPDFPGGVVEWCINTAAVDPATKSILVNSEDGWLYRWDLATNTLSQKVRLTSGLGESYTPTAIGPDGTVYAINNATLFAVGK
jgi:WD40 repeat protein